MRLGSFSYRRVRVTCVWCPRRRGDYCTERLIARLGAQASLDEVMRHITASCRWPKPWGVRGPNAYRPWCRAAFEDLQQARPPDRIRGSSGPGIS